MPVTLHDRTMTSHSTSHAARLAPGTQHHRDLSWLPGHRLRPHIQGWTAEPGITATAETEPERPDPEAGA